MQKGIISVLLTVLFAQYYIVSAQNSDRLVFKLKANTFYHAGQPDTPDEEHDGTETCAVPCEVYPHGAVGDTNLAGPCGCIGPEGNCNEEFAGGFVKDLCNRMGNNPVSALARAGTQMESPVQRRLQATQKLLQLKAGAECWQESSIARVICNIIFAADSRPLLDWLRNARSKNIKFSHCSLSFGDEPPLKSSQCFTPNETLSEGVPRVVLAHLRALTGAEQAPKLKFVASFDDNREFVTQELVFVTKYENLSIFPADA
ncbi:g9803 [Coccomyxa elongata]